MEVALSINAFRKEATAEEPRPFVRPVGSVLVAISNDAILAKWVEICCDLTQRLPERMAEALPKNCFDEIMSDWKPKWRAWYQDILRKNDDPKQLTPAEVWTRIANAGSWITRMPKDDRDEVDITTTWLWSPLEKREFVLCKLDSDVADAASRGDYTAEGEDRQGPLYRIDWSVDADLTPEEQADILNPAKSHNPKRLSRLLPSVVRSNHG